MQPILRIIPIATVIVLVVLSVLPWGVGQSLGFMLPLLPFLAIYYWMRRHSHLMPTLFVFASGLAVDVLSYGPLGYWSIVYLAGLGLTALLERSGVAGRSVAGWAGFCGVIAGLAFIAWLVASLYYVRFIDWQPMARAAAALLLVYPLFRVLLDPLDRLVSEPQSPNFKRRA